MSSLDVNFVSERYVADMLLLATRCIFIYALEEMVPTLPAVYVIKTIELINSKFATSPIISKLLSLSFDELRELLMKSGYVKDILLERRGNILKIRIVGCTVAPNIHRYMTRKEHLCPLLVLVLATLKRHFRELKFTGKYPTITEDGAEAEFEVR